MGCAGDGEGYCCWCMLTKMIITVIGINSNEYGDGDDNGGSDGDW